MKNPLNRILERSSGVGNPNCQLICTCETCGVDRIRAFLTGPYNRVWIQTAGQSWIRAAFCLGERAPSRTGHQHLGPRLKNRIFRSKAEWLVPNQRQGLTRPEKPGQREESRQGETVVTNLTNKSPFSTLSVMGSSTLAVLLHAYVVWSNNEWDNKRDSFGTGVPDRPHNLAPHSELLPRRLGLYPGPTPRPLEDKVLLSSYQPPCWWDVYRRQVRRPGKFLSCALSILHSCEDFPSLGKNRIQELRIQQWSRCCTSQKPKQKVMTWVGCTLGEKGENSLWL